jgi:hypothetical protein
MIALDRYYEGINSQIDLEETMSNPDAAGELEIFRKIFCGLKEPLNSSGTRELLGLLKLDLKTLRSLNELHQTSELATALSHIITFLEERYGSRVLIVTKFKSFTDADLDRLLQYIVEYQKVSGLLSSLFNRGKIRQLNNNFKRDFPFCQFEDPRKCIE